MKALVFDLSIAKTIANYQETKVNPATKLTHVPGQPNANVVLNFQLNPPSGFREHRADAKSQTDTHTQTVGTVLAKSLCTVTFYSGYLGLQCCTMKYIPMATF